MPFEPPRCAEARKRERLENAGSKARNLGSRSDAQRLLHELEVRQIALEMQNAELQKARDKAEAALAKYTDLYDLAPVGYFSLDPQGRILEANLTGAALLGVEPSELISLRLQHFLAPTSRPIFVAFLARVFGSTGEQISRGGTSEAGRRRYWGWLPRCARRLAQQSAKMVPGGGLRYFRVQPGEGGSAPYEGSVGREPVVATRISSCARKWRKPSGETKNVSIRWPRPLGSSSGKSMPTASTRMRAGL